jgi:Na+-transporting NADH:ubiquinone oxidoreductase subunit F
MGGIAGALSVILVLSEKYIANYGECRININDDEETSFTIEGGGNLLFALSERKIFIPSACGGQGTCGYCKVKVLEGGGDVLPTEKPYLSRAEIRSNVRLSCQVKVRNDLRLEIPEELLAVQEYQTRCSILEDLTHDTKLLRFDLIEPPETKFKPGQYFQIRVPDEYLQGLNPPIYDPIFRAYSTAWMPKDNNFLEFIIRLVPGGICTTWVHNTLKVGDEITITGPYGDFYLNDESQRPVLCVAGGSGVAPVRSILEHLFDKGTEREVWYFFGARAIKDLYYHKENIERAKQHPNFTYVPALSAMDPGDEWDGETGFIHTVIDKMIEDPTEMEAYLCGPPVMIDAVIEMLTGKGMPEERISFDKF